MTTVTIKEIQKDVAGYLRHVQAREAFTIVQDREPIEEIRRYIARCSNFAQLDCVPANSSSLMTSARRYPRTSAISPVKIADAARGASTWAESAASGVEMPVPRLSE
jgi:antitoxin (DNA-binding transcriptional repressor) of toxin-antitoxin stability system